MAETFHIFETAFGQLDLSLMSFISDTSANATASLSVFAHGTLAIYVCLWGWGHMRGIVSESVADGVMRIIRLSFITSLSINVGIYNQYLGDLLWRTPDALAAAIVSGPASSPNIQFLDSLMSQMYDLGSALWARANLNPGLVPDLALLAAAVAVWIMGIAATGYGAFLLVLSKIALAILLGVGPIFVSSLIFESTKKFFDAWIGQCLNYVFLVVLSAGAIKLIMSVLAHYLTDVTAVGAMTIASVNQAIPAMAIALVAILVLMQLPSIASALGGGVAISTLGALSYAHRKATGAISAVRPTNIRRAVNGLRSDARALGGVAALAKSGPMAVYRKVTGASQNRVSKG
jgi:type IV secretion system protein VirB6